MVPPPIGKALIRHLQDAPAESRQNRMNRSFECPSPDIVRTCTVFAVNPPCIVRSPRQPAHDEGPGPRTGAFVSRSDRLLSCGSYYFCDPISCLPAAAAPMTPTAMRARAQIGRTGACEPPPAGTADGTVAAVGADTPAARASNTSRDGARSGHLHRLLGRSLGRSRELRPSQPRPRWPRRVPAAASTAGAGFGAVALRESGSGTPSRQHAATCRRRYRSPPAVGMMHWPLGEFVTRDRAPLP